MFRLVVLPCFDLCRSNSFHVYVHVRTSGIVVQLHIYVFVHLTLLYSVVVIHTCLRHVSVYKEKFDPA